MQFLASHLKLSDLGSMDLSHLVFTPGKHFTANWSIPRFLIASHLLAYLESPLFCLGELCGVFCFVFESFKDIFS